MKNNFSSGKSEKIGVKNFHQRKLFPEETLPDKVYLTFMKALSKFGPPAKRLPTSFSAVTPTNIGIRPQKPKAIPSASSKSL